MTLVWLYISAQIVQTLVVFTSWGSLICFWTACIVCLNRVRSIQLFHRSDLLFLRSVPGPRNNSPGLCLFFSWSVWDQFLSTTDLCVADRKLFARDDSYMCIITMIGALSWESAVYSELKKITLCSFTWTFPIHPQSVLGPILLL